MGSPPLSGAVGVDPVLASPYRRGAYYDWEEQARVQSMLAADHSLALREGRALHRAAHDGASWAKAAAFEQAVDKERALAHAARSADLAAAEELHARSAELAARSADQWRREELQLGGAVAKSAADLRALAMEEEILAARGGAVRSSLEGALRAQGLAERTLLHADARTGIANCGVAAGELELKASLEVLERTKEGFSMAHKSSCDAEATHHRARELLANREAAAPALAVRVREAHEQSQDALRHQEAAADCLKDAERMSSQAESEEQDSRRTLEDCQREFESAVAELKSAIQIKTEAGKHLAGARRVEVEAVRTVDMATQEMIRSEEAKQFVKSLATQADATATFAESQSHLRLAKFPPDPEGVQHAAESRAKQQQSQEQSQKAEREFEQAGRRLVQKRQGLEDVRGRLERAGADYQEKEQKGRDCAAKARTREVELESARARHEEAAAQLARATAVLTRARGFYQQQEQLYLDKKALEEKLSAEQAEAQSALENAKKAVAAAAENVTGARQHLAEITSQLHISRKRADNARLGASTSRGNQAWSAVAEEQARAQSMLAADHGLALREGWALHRAAHDGASLAKAAAFEQEQARVQSMLAADHSLALQEGRALLRAAHDGASLAKAAAFEQAVDEERALARAARSADLAAAAAAAEDLAAAARRRGGLARSADLAAAEAAELDFRADVAGREAALLGAPPIAMSPRRWRGGSFDAAPVPTGAVYPSVCFSA